MTVLRTFLIWSILGCNEIKYGIYIHFIWKIMRNNATDKKGETNHDRNETFIL